MFSILSMARGKYLFYDRYRCQKTCDAFSKQDDTFTPPKKYPALHNYGSIADWQMGMLEARSRLYGRLW